MIYKTKQKEEILRYISNYKEDFTIKNIYDDFNGKVGLTTIYRLVNNLVLDGIVVKNITDDNVTYYHYLEKCDCENHFYLKCDKCGKLEHIDCNCIKVIKEHIKDKHNFVLNKEKIFINGLCYKCSKGV